MRSLTRIYGALLLCLSLTAIPGQADDSDYVAWYGTVRIHKLRTVDQSKTFEPGNPYYPGVELLKEHQEWSGSIRYLPGKTRTTNSRFQGSHLLDRRTDRMDSCPWKDEKTAYHDYETNESQEASGGTIAGNGDLKLLFKPTQLEYKMSFILSVPPRKDGITYKSTREFYTDCSLPHLDHKEQSVKSFSSPLSVEVTVKATADQYPPEKLEGSQKVVDEDDGGLIDVSWSLTRSAPAVTARITGPSVIQRGDEVTLDSSTSSGNITQRKWNFSLGEDCGGAVLPIDFEMSGTSVHFKALCTFTAWLEVEDAQGQHDRATHEVVVERREGAQWRTRFSTSKGAPLSSPLISNGMHLGVNQCALHPAEETSGHMIHTDAPNSKTWLEFGYRVEQVTDAGPFSGLWFVKDQNLEIKRVERVNQGLMPSGAAYLLNKSKGSTRDIEALLAQVTAHEALHSSLVSESLQSLGQNGDPAQRVEKVIASSKDLLQTLADMEVRDVEGVLREASSEDRVHSGLRSKGNFSRSISIWLPDSYGNPTLVDMGPLWNIGD